MDKSFRVHTNVGKDTLLNVSLRQDMDFMEILSLRLRQKDAYKLHSSNYGVIVGRVLANDAFGIPNAKVSVFVQVDNNETVENKNLYPYKSVTSLDDKNIRYNLLPDDSNDDCYRIVGTFPNKTEMLDEDTKIEIFDKYWKYTTVTNNAGDYMIFGVPVGNQQIHVDLDLSDIGILSQKPRDMFSKGYTVSDFDSANQFKTSTNLGNLAQIISQDTSVYVYPFWGDTDNGIVGITRSDVQVNYKFEPTCVFLGSLISDNGTNAIGHECSPQKKNGRNVQLVAGEGSIEMIRKTPDGLVEEYQIEGNRVIDENGTWCYQIPMNLDYVGTDEFGNICPTEDPSKGIPTRTRVRFRVSKDDNGDEGFSRHTAKILIPNNPTLMPDEETPRVANGAEIEKAYTFGSSTPDEHFRDLYWNRVYSIKSYIPRFQTSNRQNTEYYSAIKSVNVTDNQNVMPFNRLNVKLPFMFVIVCILFKILLVFLCMYNMLFINTLYRFILCPFIGFKVFGKRIGFTPWCIKLIPCASFGAGLGETDNITYLPCCDCPDGGGCKAASCEEDGCTKTSSTGDLNDRVEQKLALSYNIIHLDMYNDWVNGTVYLPLWYWRVRKKKTFLFGLFSFKAKNDYCKCDKDSGYKHIHFLTACDLGLNNSYDYKDGHKGEKYHADKSHVAKVTTHKGIIKPVENKDGLTVYYYASMLPSNTNKNSKFKDFSDYTGKTDVIRAFATDIILLGSLNENDSDGLPDFYNTLPITTANVPEIATVESSNSSDDDNNTAATDDAMGSEETGSGMITGMDWQRNADKGTPKYGKGLFMDLGCTKIRTKPKSCINASRMCELNVSMDMSFNVQYSTETSLKKGTILPDGLISKTELETNEGRAMFATMNHLGFVPTNVAEDKLGISTQVKHPVTSYYVNKFQFIYPTDFDGRLADEAADYTNSGQITLDKKDEAYMRFRFGYSANNKKYKFYSNNGSGANTHRFPLFNNSFYFYFGIKPGDTALDKFRKIYNAACTSDKKYPFTMDVLTRENKTCPKTNLDNSFIYVDLSDIQAPFSYTLYDANGDVMIAENSIYSNHLSLGTSDTGFPLTLESVTEGKLYYHDMNGNPIEDSGEVLSNGNYTLTITDVNGNTLSERIILEASKIRLSYQTVDLSKKYYDNFTNKKDLCNDNSPYHGSIIFDTLTIDGKDYEITRISAGGISTISDNALPFLIYVDGYDESPAAQVEIKPVRGEVDESDKLISVTADDCFCDGNSRIKNNKELSVFIPGKYLLQVTAYCNGALNYDNTSDEVVTVNNYTAFNVYVNTVPLKFLIGDKVEASGNKASLRAIGNIDNPNYYNEKFYAKGGDIQTSPDGSDSFQGWYHAYNEKYYSFSPLTKKYETIWSDFLSSDDIDMNTLASKLSAIKFKFNCLFKLSEGVYCQGKGDNTLSITYTGGVSPILLRGMRPTYENGDNVTDKVVYGSTSTFTCDSHHPNIVGSNYVCSQTTDNEEERMWWGYTLLPLRKRDNFLGGVSQNIPFFNLDYEFKGRDNYQSLGNYFAGFTQNAGINKELTVPVEAIPVQANPHSEINISKTKKDSRFGQNLFSDVYTGQWSYVRGLFMDRRLDYDYLIIGSNTSKLPLSSLSATPFNNGAKISGTTFNGIEMAYDEEDDYNIIGDNLEYSYDSKTTIWNTGSDVKRRFYSASINGIDIRDHYVYAHCDGISSGQNGERYYAKNGSSIAVDDTRPNESKWFGEDGGKTFTDYPTRRSLVVDSLMTFGSIEFETTSCSYSISPSLNTDGWSGDTDTDIGGLIKASTTEGEQVSFEIDYTNLVNLVNVDIGAGDNYNVDMKFDTKNNKFVTQEIQVTCTLNPLEVEGVDVATTMPSLFNLTNWALGELKAKTESAILPSSMLKQEETGLVHDYVTADYSTNKTFFGAVENRGYRFDDEGVEKTCCFACMCPVELPDGVKYNDYGGWGELGLLRKNGEPLTDNDSDFTAIKYHKTIKDNRLAEVDGFTILTEKYLRNNANDYLLKHIRLINTNDYYDLRPLKLSFVGDDISTESLSKDDKLSIDIGDYITGETGSFNNYGAGGALEILSNGTKIGNSYGVFSVLKESDKSASALASLNEEVNPETGEKSYSGNETEITTSQLGHTQYLVFKLQYNGLSGTTVNPTCNEAFSVYNTCQFRFVFTTNGRTITVTNPIVKPFDTNDARYLILIVQWPSQDGAYDTIGADKSTTQTVLYAKASNGFVYKLNFTFNGSNPTGSWS